MGAMRFEVDGKIVYGGPKAFKEHAQMSERLETFVRQLKKEKIVYRIVEAPKEERMAIYEAERERLEKDAVSFVEDVRCIVECSSYVFQRDTEYTISRKNVVEICMFCIMTGIEISRLFMDTETIIECLDRKRGKLYHTSQKLAELLYFNNGSFSGYTEEEILKEIFEE